MILVMMLFLRVVVFMDLLVLSHYFSQVLFSLAVQLQPEFVVVEPFSIAAITIKIYSYGNYISLTIGNGG